jgi:hypothetical protein
MLAIFSKEIMIISEKLETIKQLIGHDDILNKRIRRGLVNGESTFLKWLIGTSDANDAEHYDNAIKFLQNQNNKTQVLLQRQTTIMSSTKNAINQSSTSLKLIQDKFNKKFVKFNNEFSEQFHNQLNQIRNFELICEHFSLLTQLITDLKEDLDIIISSISLVRSNTGLF